MPLPTPFHDRTSARCASMKWKEWAGYYAVCSYELCHEPEYFAVRHAAGLIDVTPLYKLDVSGPDATAFLDWVTARHVGRLKLGQVGYGCWCDASGRVLDDGTITRRDDASYRVTSADPSYGWLVHQARRFDVRIEDVSDRLAAVALQGPAARSVLGDACDDDVSGLRFFRAMRTRIAGVDVDVTRTGYTGDLGYEVWAPNDGALVVWDALVEAGRPHGMTLLGLDALDVCRIEAGFVLLGVDYFSARRCVLPSQTSTPFELGLGWSVHLDRDPFVGSEALAQEQQAGSEWALVGLHTDWDELERLYDSFKLPPHLASSASRVAVPVYADTRRGVQVGQATSSTWSPVLKQHISLASVRTPHAAVGTELGLEVTVEFERHRIRATVVDTPFFDPERKRATPRSAAASGQPAAPATEPMA